MCKARIETAAKLVKGVLSAEWNVDTKKIKVDYNTNVTNTNTIENAIAKAGHDTENYKTDDKIYNELPACCRYRE